MKSLAFSICFFMVLSLFGQDLTGPQLLEKAIAYHDPSGNWETFNGSFQVTMETPKKTPRLSEIMINLPGEYFQLKATRDTITTEYSLQKNACNIKFNGSEDLSEATLKENNLSCERAVLFKNYYTYLYGLPMKLKDQGTHISKKVERKTFKGKEYFVLKATYDEAVGSDVWYFYFDPETFAMEVYQFFKGDPAAKGKDTGEYILLSETVTINNIKMPKNRAWYYNKDDEYLGSDILMQSK
jgi:hypothetical protein